MAAGLRVLQQIRDAITTLNPTEVRAAAMRDVTIGLNAPDEAGFARLESFFLQPGAPPVEPASLARVLHRRGAPGAPTEFSLEVVEAGQPHTDGQFVLDLARPDLFFDDVLARREELGLALARNVPVFRTPVITRAIRTVSRENALFALATAVPSMIPLLSLPLSVGEFASDAAVLTMNQIRLGFLIAAATGHDLGYREQRGEIGSLVAGAFGWRAIARELVGKIPLGGGLIPKAAIAYAGTYVVGLGLERYYRYGHQLGDAERKAAYEAALQRGKAVVAGIMETVQRLKKQG